MFTFGLIHLIPSDRQLLLLLLLLYCPNSPSIPTDCIFLNLFSSYSQRRTNSALIYLQLWHIRIKEYCILGSKNTVNQNQRFYCFWIKWYLYRNQRIYYNEIEEYTILESEILLFESNLMKTHELREQVSHLNNFLLLAINLICLKVKTWV